MSTKYPELSSPDNLELIEGGLLSLPQVECPVVHHFGPGIYIREVTIPAGTLAIGHAQKFHHLNILLKGSVAMIIDGAVKVVKAPLIFTGSPGRKLGYALEDTVWQNIYATEETDIEKLEDWIVDKSQTWQDHHKELSLIQQSIPQLSVGEST